MEDETIVQPGEFTPDETVVYSEADREEFISAIDEVTGGTIGRKVIGEVVRAESIALALLIARSSQKRVEIYGGDIVRVKHVEQRTGHDPAGNEYTEGEHFVVYTKKHAVALDILEAQLKLPCKNG